MNRLRRAVWAVLFVLTFTPGVARADQPTINVQLINVCADDGTNCALSSPAASYGYSPAAIQRVFDQAGINVNLLAPVQYNNSAYLNPAVIDDPDHGYQTGSPTDPAHQLLDLPGHLQNTDSQVLNVFLVNTLPHTTSVSGVSTPASTLYGIGLQNANGTVVTTGLNNTPAGIYVAGIDNIAHELAHNLGLTHVNDPPLAGTFIAAGTAVTLPAAEGTYPNQVPVTSAQNLLDGTGRLVPGNPCAVAQPLCANVIPGGKDQLLPFQIQGLQQSATNLFQVNLASATAKALFNDSSACTAGGIGCTVQVTFNSAPTPQSLLAIKLRYLGNAEYSGPDVLTVDPQITLGGSATNLSACTLSFTNESLALGSVQAGLTANTGCLTQGSSFLLSANAGPREYNFAPFSAEFDFSDGITSTALFDKSGIARSTKPIAIGNLKTPNQNGPALPIPTDPTLFNRVVVPEGDDGVPYRPGGPPVDGSTDGPIGVPEPATLPLLLSGLLAAVVFRPRMR